MISNQEPGLLQAEQIVENYIAMWHETECTGYDALETRVTTSHQKNVWDGGYRFRSTGIWTLRNAVTFNWEMFRPGDKAVESSGFDILVLADDGRILSDYQFVVS
jgi:hypothetical protein